MENPDPTVLGTQVELLAGNWTDLCETMEKLVGEIGNPARIKLIELDEAACRIVFSVLRPDQLH